MLSGGRWTSPLLSFTQTLTIGVRHTQRQYPINLVIGIWWQISRTIAMSGDSTNGSESSLKAFPIKKDVTFSVELIHAHYVLFQLVYQELEHIVNSLSTATLRHVSPCWLQGVSIKFAMIAFRPFFCLNTLNWNTEPSLKACKKDRPHKEQS